LYGHRTRRQPGWFTGSVIRKSGEGIEQIIQATLKKLGS